VAGEAELTLWRHVLLLVLAAISLPAETRRALVIGIGEYKNVPRAPQSAPSARAFARALAGCQFQVALLIDVEADALAREINKFLQELKPGDSAAFYFSGYAVQDTGENYLLPAGYNPQNADGIEFQSYSVKRLVRYLESKKLATGLVILDPAPSNQAIEKKFPEPGLASIDLRAANLVLAMANLPGRAVPPAASREMGRFTEAWMEAAATPGATVDTALRRVKQQVSQVTNGEQVPSEVSTLVNEFTFQPRSPAATEWDRISASSDVAVLESFRQKFIGDPLAIEAGNRIRYLEWQRAKATGDANVIRQFVSRYPQHKEALAWLSAQAATEKTSDSSGVLSAIERYAKAYESRDVDGLHAIRPGLSPSERKRLEQAFREFKSIRYSLLPQGEPAIDPTGATVKCRMKVEMRGADGGAPRPVDQAVTVRLKRQGDAWIVDSIQ